LRLGRKNINAAVKEFTSLKKFIKLWVLELLFIIVIITTIILSVYFLLIFIRPDPVFGHKTAD
jgi:hypothetical protein